MSFTPDGMIFARWGPIVLNATIVYTWVVMAFLIGGSWFITSRLRLEPPLSRWQLLLETLVEIIGSQIRDITEDDPKRYLPFLGTLFIFISFSNFMDMVPVYTPPTASFSTAAALAACVFFAVPIYGITAEGLFTYLKHYIEPSVFMLPFNIISEFSRTLALAVRLFGIAMSGTLLVGILLSIVPFVLPVVMQALGLLIGQIQAYIFAVLAAVYIASGMRARRKGRTNQERNLI